MSAKYLVISLLSLVLMLGIYPGSFSIFSAEFELNDAYAIDVNQFFRQNLAGKSKDVAVNIVNEARRKGQLSSQEASQLLTMIDREALAKANREQLQKTDPSTFNQAGGAPPGGAGGAGGGGLPPFNSVPSLGGQHPQNIPANNRAMACELQCRYTVTSRDDPSKPIEEKVFRETFYRPVAVPGVRTVSVSFPIKFYQRL